VELVEIEMKNVTAPSHPADAPEHAAVKGETEPVPVEQEPHHRWIFENQYVRVLDVVLAPGESTLFHTHSHDSIAVRRVTAAT
jgi:quercetin dioxygenase-like cupin family protein